MVPRSPSDTAPDVPQEGTAPGSEELRATTSGNTTHKAKKEEDVAIEDFGSLVRHELPEEEPWTVPNFPSANKRTINSAIRITYTVSVTTEVLKKLPVAPNSSMLRGSEDIYTSSSSLPPSCQKYKKHQTGILNLVHSGRHILQSFLELEQHLPEHSLPAASARD